MKSTTQTLKAISFKLALALAALGTLGLATSASAEEKKAEAKAAPTAEEAAEYIKFTIDHADTKKGLVHGKFATFELVKANVNSDNLDKSWAEFTVDISSIDTGIEKRDGHLQMADFFETAKFPAAKFKVHTLKSTDAGYTGIATVTIKETTKDIPVTFKSIKEENGKIWVEGQAAMTRSDFSVGAAPEKSGAADSVTIDIKLAVWTKE